MKGLLTNEKKYQIGEMQNDKTYYTKKRSCKISTIINIVFLLLIALFIFAVGVGYSDNFKTNSKSTKLGFEDVGELVTQTAYVTVVNDTKNSRDFFKLFDIPFTQSRQIFSYDIEVDASVDFTKVEYSENDKEKRIIINVPHSQIYKATVNLDSYTEYLDQDNLFSRIELSEHNDVMKSMEEQAIIDAKENGILEAADKNAKKLIEGFVKSNPKYKDYEIVCNYKEK